MEGCDLGDIAACAGIVAGCAAVCAGVEVDAPLCVACLGSSYETCKDCF